MTNPALAIIEEVYEMALNPDGDYLAQLQPLAPSGELANKLLTSQVLFKLCMLVDTQAKQIVSLQEKIQGGVNNATASDQPKLDPQKPL